MAFLTTDMGRPIPGPIPIRSPGANKFKAHVWDIFNKGKAVARQEFSKAKSSQVPKLRAELSQSFGSIFRQVKARAVEAVANTGLAQEVKAQEVRKMVPMIIVAAVVLLIVGYLVARRS